MAPAAVLAAVLVLTGCSSYSGIIAVQRPAEPQDAIPAGVRQGNPDLPSDFRLLTEDAGIKYFGAESADFRTACIAVYPIDDPDQWGIGCSEGITSDREVVTVSHTGQPTVKLVTTGFDTRALESDGWRKVHDNVLVSRSMNP